MPTPLKPRNIRQRRNKASTRNRFETDEQPRQRPPRLGRHPDGEAWHHEAKEFWESLWKSPMSGEFLRVDLGGLRLLTHMVDRYWKKPNTVLAEAIRRHRDSYGLSPLGRRRLEWEIVRVEKPKAPKRKKKAEKPFDPVAALSESDESLDPRVALRVG